MSTKNSNQPVVPSAREALEKFKMEAAQDFSVKRHIEKQPSDYIAWPAGNCGLLLFLRIIAGRPYPCIAFF